MSNVGHTPAPWIAEKDTATNGSFNIYGSFNKEGLGVRLAIVTTGPAELSNPRWGYPEYLGTQGSANAELIASSPDLLSAMERAERFVGGFEGDELQEGVDELLSMMRAALAKATGKELAA